MAEVRSEEVRVKLCPEHYAARFAAMTGHGMQDSSRTFQAIFGWLHDWTEDGKPDRKGFYLYGGTGCGKTTLAELFARDYKVVSCLDVASDYEAKNSQGIKSYQLGSVCFDDLGAEQKVYGKEPMADVVQARYDRMVFGRGVFAQAKRRLEEMQEIGRRNGWSREELSDFEGCKSRRGEPETLQMCGWAVMEGNARENLKWASQLVPLTCFTSNLTYDEVEARYGQRVASRLYEMCDFIDFSKEIDHRIN